MSRGKCRSEIGFLLENPQGRDTGCQNRRLGIRRQFEIVLRARETELSKIKTKGIVRFFEDLLRNSKVIGKILAHPRIL